LLVIINDRRMENQGIFHLEGSTVSTRYSDIDVKVVAIYKKGGIPLGSTALKNEGDVTLSIVEALSCRGEFVVYSYFIKVWYGCI
jgi:hypothetical protein